MWIPIQTELVRHDQYHDDGDEFALHRWESEGGRPCELGSADRHRGAVDAAQANMAKFLAKPNRLRTHARARRRRTSPARSPYLFVS